MQEEKVYLANTFYFIFLVSQHFADHIVPVDADGGTENVKKTTRAEGYNSHNSHLGFHSLYVTLLCHREV